MRQPAHRTPHTATLGSLALTAAMLVLGCAESPTDATPTLPDGARPPGSAFATTCQEGVFTGFYATNGWACNATVHFYTDVPEIASDLGSAVGAWRSRLAATGFSDLPAFYITADPSQAEATVTGTGYGTEFCGTWNNSSRVLTVYADAGCNNFDNKGPLPALLRHEVGHAVGWTGSSVDKVIFATAAAEHCVMNLPSDGSLNPTICAHEIEGALAAYGLVGYDYEDFFTTPFVVGANSLTPLYLQTGQVDTLSPGEWHLDGGGTVSGTSSAYSWSTTNSNVATVSGGVVTAVGPGTATIRAVPQPSSSYHHAHPFRNQGVSTTVTVTSPPPEFIVTADQMPIITPGNHTFTAHLGTSNSTVYWAVDDSRTTTVNPDMTFSTAGQVAQFNVASGSYTLTISVSLSPWGGGQQQDIPVCTAGEEPVYLAWLFA
jgi:hypothetical protein